MFRLRYPKLLANSSTDTLASKEKYAYLELKNILDSIELILVSVIHKQKVSAKLYRPN